MLGTITQNVNVDTNVDVSIDVEEILDEIDTEDLLNYLIEERDIKVPNFNNTDEMKETIIELCIGRVTRNLETDKEEIKAAICSLIDELFI